MSDREAKIDEDATTRSILEFMSRPGYRPMPQRELLHRLHVDGALRPSVRRLVRRLLDEGVLVRAGRGMLAPGGSDRVRGILQVHPEGYGFVVAEGGGPDVFVPAKALGDALGGDRVVARVQRRGADGRLSGVLERRTEGAGREPRRLPGVFVPVGRGGVVQPFDSKLGQRIGVAPRDRAGARRDHVVIVQISGRARDGEGLEGRIVEILGMLDDPGVDVEVICRKYGLRQTFPPQVRGAAEGLPKRVGPREKAQRQRFDDPAPVTIDGETARDFDDAVAVARQRGGGFRLWVHIADVSHFVAPGSELDREAGDRGTSVYFPETVLPMFPEQLSNDLCSLRPGVDRLVQTAILDFDAEGHLRRTRFADGVIRSAARLTYRQVAAVIDGEKRVTGVPTTLVPMLEAANDLRRLLEQRRHRRGSIDFDLPEPQLLLDVEGVVTGVTIEPRNRAHRMIEEFMLAANEAVAGYLTERGAACVFRVHDSPEPLKLETLRRFVETFGLTLKLPRSGQPKPSVIQRLIEQVAGRPEESLVAQVALRSMKQARYSTVNSGHFGLAAPVYCHFTSPIRRYPDLLVHRLLRQTRRRRPAGEDSSLDELETMALRCSELERNAESAERELLAWKKIALIRDRVGEEFDGVITAAARFGLFVQLTDNLVEGLVRVEQLGGEYFEFDESRLELRSARGNKAYRIGDRLRVRVDRVDRVLRRVDLSIVSVASRADPQRRASKRGGPGRARGNRRRVERKRPARRGSSQR